MDVDLSQQISEYKNWIRAAIAEEEKRRCAWCNSLLNEYHNYRDKFADNDRQFDRIDSIMISSRWGVLPTYDNKYM